jgi:predicted acylesterase/phospholipase RssA
VRNAVFITGAAARIGQETAIIDLLLSKSGLLIKQGDTVIVGYSSGSINLLGINGCFREKSPLSWKTYYEGKLFDLRDSNIFKLLPPTGKSILNTAPFKVYLDQIMRDMNFRSFGDLPFHSYVITSQLDDASTYWADNRIPGNAQLAPTELFMASTAIPILLPSVAIPNTRNPVNRQFPQGNFSDGGTFGDFTNFPVVLGDIVQKYGTLDRLDIISPMRESLDDSKEMIKNGLLAAAIKKEDHEGIVAKLENFSLNIGLKAFQKFIVSLNDDNKKNSYARQILVTIPQMPANTGFLSFGKQQFAYDTVYQWLSGDGASQLAMPIDRYIAFHNLS